MEVLKRDQLFPGLGGERAGGCPTIAGAIIPFFWKVDFLRKSVLYVDLTLDIGEGKKMLVRLGGLSRRGLSPSLLVAVRVWVANTRVRLCPEQTLSGSGVLSDSLMGHMKLAAFTPQVAGFWIKHQDAV